MARLAWLFLPLVLASGGMASANDGFGALGAGGIAIAHTNVLAMAKEDLYVSPQLIEVHYIFENESDQDVHETVSFPLPPYPANPNESGVIANGQPDQFSIDVNGTPVQFRTRVWAVLPNGRDVTSDLTALGFSEQDIALVPFEENTRQTHQLDRPSATLAKLSASGLTDTDGVPLWTNHVAYEWTQSFPAHKQVRVVHRYIPFASMGAWDGYSPQSENAGDSSLKQVFCADDNTVRTLGDLYSKPDYLDAYGTVPGSVVDYILTTGNTWKDGIRDFTLTVDKVAPYSLVATCFEGKLTRKSGTLLESRIQNFHPKSELKIYFGNLWAQSRSRSLRPSFNGNPSTTE